MPRHVAGFAMVLALTLAPKAYSRETPEATPPAPSFRMSPLPEGSYRYIANEEWSPDGIVYWLASEGRLQEALERSEYFLGRNPDDRWVKLERVKVLIAMGRLDAAAKELAPLLREPSAALESIYLSEREHVAAALLDAARGKSAKAAPAPPVVVLASPPAPRWPLALASGIGGLLLGFAAAALLFRRRRA